MESIIVVGIVLLLVFLAIRMVMKLVSGAADVAVLVRFGKQLKNPETTPDQLRIMTIACRNGATELFPQIAGHPNTYPALKEWISAYRSMSRREQANASEPPRP